MKILKWEGLKKELLIPTEFGELTIDLYQRMLQADYGNPFEFMGEVFEISKGELEFLPTKSFIAWFDDWIKNLLIDVDKTVSKHIPKKILGKYIVPKDLEHITGAQWLDAKSFISSMSDDDERSILFPHLLSIFCLKKDEVYGSDGFDQEARSEAMRQVDMVKAQSINAFFLTSSNIYRWLFSQSGIQTPIERTKLERELTSLSRDTANG